MLRLNQKVKISKKLFSQVWMRHFKDRLRIRFDSHHAKCGQCIRHRLIMRKLGHCPGALRAQRSQLDKHLERQHRDRQVYWFERARSRLCATNLGSYTLTAIIDSMDQAKHAWPRSVAMQAKCFNSWSRPRLVSTTMLCHGRLALMCLSPHFVTANSSRTCEVVCVGLSMLQKKRVGHAPLLAEPAGDNCSKEFEECFSSSASGFERCTSSAERLRCLVSGIGPQSRRHRCFLQHCADLAGATD